MRTDLSALSRKLKNPPPPPPPSSASASGWRKQLVKKGQVQPVWWVENILGNYLWSKQREIANALVTNERVAVPASFGVGKTFLAGRLALWFLFNYRPSKVITTAPTARQVKDLLWSEIRTAHAASSVPLGGDPLQLSLTLKDDHFAVGFSTDETNMDKFTGYHSPNQLVIFDQAGGIPRSIWQAAEGLMTSSFCRWLAISNTAISDCVFADICIPGRTHNHGNWKTIKIRASETPNVVAGKNVIDGLISHDWVKKQQLIWSPDDPLYRIFIEAEFVDSTELRVIPFPLHQAAWDNPGKMASEISIGVDVATTGLDSTVMVASSGTRALRMKRITGHDAMQVTGATISFKRELERDFNIPVSKIKVDSIGVGSGVASRLAEQDFPVIPVNNAKREEVAEKDRFRNIRAEMAWALRSLFESFNVGLAMLETETPQDMEFLKQDINATKYKLLSNGQIQILDKEEIKKDLNGRSPDYWDALVLSFCDPGAAGDQMVEFLSSMLDNNQLSISTKLLTDDEWQRFLGQDIRVDDPTFEEIY